MKKIPILLVLIVLVSTPLVSPSAFCSPAQAEHFCESGIAFFRLGKYEDALAEFEKALRSDPDNEFAKKYIEIIFKREISASRGPAPSIKLPTPIKPKKEDQVKSKPIKKTSAQRSGRSTAASIPQPKKAEKETPLKLAGEAKTSQQEKKDSSDKGKVKEKQKLILHGEQRVSLGFTSEDVIWKETNADRIGVPREKNWRYLWGDQRHNTYDPKIYDRLTLNMQTSPENPLNSFMEITFDPWTFVGKNHVTVAATAGADTVDMDLKYWSADSRTINEVYRSRYGNIINLKQIKVDDGKTTVTTPTGISGWNTNFNSLQPMDINRELRPIRKLWVNYTQGNYNVKIFPISDQFEALTTDDPLRLSNNHVYWEESPWLDEYEPSRIFEPDSGTFPLKKGRWIRRLSFFTKDSSDDYPHRLTFLRGASFKADTGFYSLETTLATPMSLWDDYENSNSVAEATRLKIPLNEELQLGFTTTTKLGLQGASREALNQVEALDLNYQFSDSSGVYAQAATSFTDIQEAKGFNTTYEGGAGALGFNYDAGEGKKNGIYQAGLYLTHMDGKFYPALSNYRYTRNESPTFSKHIYFAEIKEDDRSLIWGDGIDRGRNVIGLKLKTKGFNERLDTDIKYRYVRKHNGKYVESVLRSESTYQANPKLTHKLLAYYQHLPRTHANYDPLIYAKTMYSLTDYFSEEDVFAENSAVLDDKDPSVGAFGWGAKYDWTEKFSLEGVYERTNDPLDFPRGLLNNTSATTETKDGVVWDKVIPYLYDQKFFDQPPYHYYNIAKTRFIYKPQEAWEFILSAAYNENKHATGIDNNISHVGLESNFRPSDKLTLWFKYIYSRLIDVYKQNKYQCSDFYEGHHNVFFGSEYKFDPDSSFTMLYGEFVGYDDPYEQANWTLSALDTQHIFRLFYRRKF